MPQELTFESVVFIFLFAAVAFWIYRIFSNLNIKITKHFNELNQNVERLEHQYIKLKPELDEIKVSLESKVDYKYLEKKMHELVKLIIEKAK